MPDNATAGRWWLAACVAGAVLAAVGCKGLVGVRATVLDEATRLERQALGERPVVQRGEVLLALGAPAQTDAERQELAATDARYIQQWDRLAGVRPQDFDSRLWEAIILHNRGVVRAHLGESKEAEELLNLSLQYCEAYGLGTLRWQVLLSLGELLGGETGHELHVRAADVLEKAPLATVFEYELESAGRRDELYGRLMSASLAAAAPEEAFEYALRRRAVELARAAAPDSIEFPQGPFAERVERLQQARRRLAEARQDAGKLSLDVLTAPMPGAAAARLRDAEQEVAAAADGLRQDPAAGGLIVPAVGDVFELQAMLAPDTTLLMFEPLGRGEFAGFLLRADAFEAKLVPLGAQLVAGAEWRKKAPSRKALQEFSDAALSPFLTYLGEPTRRLYLICPRELSGVAWQELPLSGKALADALQVAFVGGPADLTVAFSRKGYGRRSLLICGGWPEGSPQVGGPFAETGGVAFLDAARTQRAELAEALAYADLFWLSNPVLLRAADPGASYLAVPSSLGRLGGVGVGRLTALGSRASCAGFAGVRDDPWSPRSHAALRVVTRALAAGGVPTAVYSTGRAPKSIEQAFWVRCLEQMRSRPAGEAYRLALADVPAQHRGEFRLYGFLGMNDAEYAEYSNLEFNDRFREARGHRDAGRFGQAAAGFLDLLQMAQVLEVPEPENRPFLLANLHDYLVECWSGTRQYERAAEHQRQLIEAMRATDLAEADLAQLHLSLGALLTRAERYEDAAEAYRHALALLEEHGEPKDVAGALGELGKSFDRAAQYERALETFRMALESYKELADESGVARQLRRMGALHLKRLNRPDRAEEYFRRALQLYRTQDAAAEVIDTTLDLGLCRRHLGDLAGALKLFEDALRASEDANLGRQQARALAEIGNTHWFQGDYEGAFQHVRASSEIARGLADAFQLNVNHQLLGLVYWELNDFEKAHESLDEAVRQALRADDPLELASAYNNRGIVLRRQRRYEQALEFFGKALEIDRRLRSRWGQGYDQRNIGITLHRMERHEEAAEHLLEAVRLSEQIQDAVNLARALYSLGDLRLSQGKLQEAQPLLERALEQSRAVYLPEVEWRALRALGLLHQRREDRAEALDHLKGAVQVVEDLRVGLKVEEFRSGFLANKMDLYEDTVALLLDMQRVEEAFAYAERSRSRNFLDILARQSFSLKTEREKQLYAGQQALSRQIRALTEALRREKDAPTREGLAAELDRRRREFADLLVEIKAANPELSSFVSVEVAPLEKLYGLLGPDESLVVYYLMEKEVAIWLIRDGKVHLRRVDADRAALSDRVRDFRLLVQNREQIAEVRAASKVLFDLLVAPVGPLLAGSRVVGIVPHRSLHYLSFAGLHDGEAFLVERYPLSYAPSASVLARTLEAEREPPRGAEQRRALSVLAVGNPAVGDAAFELPFTEKEVQSLKRDFVNVTVLVGERATETWVVEHIGEFDVVHFAAHGYFDAVNPLFSALMLAPDPERQDDGVLELHEVTGLKLRAHLATLSACQSGVGRLESADELVSLSRAFLYAGTRSILSTLWRVDDVSTALLAKHFYRHYAGRRIRPQQDAPAADALPGKAASLRHAQLQVMNDGKHYHPVYWAGMILTGDYR